MKNLKQIQKYLSNIPAINNGGCGVSALSMYKWIKENSDLNNAKFVFLYYSKSDYSNNCRVLIKGNGEAKAPHHCCLLYKGVFIDCDGKIKDIEEWDWLQIIDEEDFIKKALKNIENWNDCFDRKFVKKIEKDLYINLGDIY